MSTASRFPPQQVQALGEARIIGLRSGPDHRYTGVWVVVVDGRVFVRTWNDLPTGWFRAFVAEPRGRIQLAGREVPVRGRHVRSERMRDAVTEAYGAKYTTRASQKWVAGFAEPDRARRTLELLPARAAPRARTKASVRSPARGSTRARSRR
jgi:hypothetical protein